MEIAGLGEVLTPEQQKGRFIIGSDVAKMYGYDLESFVDELVGSIGSNYTEGKDFILAMGRGDDFPNAIVINNKAILSNPKAIDFLKALEGNGEY